MATLTPEAQEIFGTTYGDPDHLWLHVHFTHSENSQAAGREFLRRFRLCSENRDPEVNGKVGAAQIEAIGKWGAAGEAVRISQLDPPADAGRERRQGRDHLLHELVHVGLSLALRGGFACRSLRGFSS
jgi:hypothetical protein